MLDEMRIATTLLAFFWATTAVAQSTWRDVNVVGAFANNRATPSSGDFSPNGELTAVAAGSYIQLFATTSGQHLRTLIGHTQEVTSVRFSPDALKIASSSRDGTVRVWSVADGKLLTKFEGHRKGREVYCVAFAPDSQTLVSGDDHGALVWDLNSGRVARSINTQGLVYAALFSADSKVVVTATVGTDDGLEVWDVVTGVRRHKFQARSHGLLRPYDGDGLAMSQDGTRLAVYSDQAVNIYDLRSGKLVQRIISPRATRLAFGAKSDEIIVGAVTYRVSTGGKVGELNLPERGEVIAFNAAKRLVLTSPHGALPKVWAFDTNKLVTKMNVSGSDAFKIGFDALGTSLFAAGGGYRMQFNTRRSTANATVWDARTGRVRYESPDPADVADVSPDGRLLAYASSAGKRAVQVIDLTTQRTVRSLLTPHEVQTIRFSPDGNKIVIATFNKTEVFDTRTWVSLLHVEDAWTHAVFLPDSQQILVQSWMGPAELWNLTLKQRVFTFRDDPNGDDVSSIAVSSDGRTLAMTGSSGWWLYDIARRQLVLRQKTRAPEPYVTAIAFSPDSKIIALARTDGVISLESLRDREVLATLGPVVGPHPFVEALVFSPDGTALAVGSGTVTNGGSITVVCSPGNRSSET